ncbi:MAG: NgoMIV family type II restriction endonuclease [Caldilineales bacterium]|nr:NgoMIV family type II restriction endonuclease [Caldilineales bacterium]MCW5858167.1 hypothetical protein [Caldilineales bacterium]
MSLSKLRVRYHQSLCAEVLSLGKGSPNIADIASPTSIAIAHSIVAQLGYPTISQGPSGQSAGRIFEELTRSFLKDCFKLLQHVRPGEWAFAIGRITQFEQYEHLAELQRLLEKKPKLKATLGGDYLVLPDIVVARRPLTDAELNRDDVVVDESETIARLTPLRASNRSNSLWILHASISCKWTIRSDRAQNIRTEGLNLIRHRKGHTPHIVAVTAEPLPTRLASLALGTGDLDCVYHFALPELQAATREAGGQEQLEMLEAMVDGRRLRDISDLPLDLAV